MSYTQPRRPFELTIRDRLRTLPALPKFESHLALLPDEDDVATGDGDWSVDIRTRSGGVRIDGYYGET